MHARTDLLQIHFMARIPATAVSFNATINAAAEGAVKLYPKAHEATLEPLQLRGHN